MTEASYTDKASIIQILATAFDTNKSVNYIIKQDSKRVERIRFLMSYSFEMCFRFGKVYLSEDRKAAALILLPHLKKTTNLSIWLDIQLVFKSIGLKSIGRVMKREKMIKDFHPKTPFMYLWFVGVKPEFQGSGVGSKLLKEIMTESHKLALPVYLETSTKKNIPWYLKQGFKQYNQLEVPYRLCFFNHA
jgi:ribosomal protein S18 acetylase RimI-like enzyme